MEIKLMKNRYIFNSDRLGFRNWLEDDLNEFAAMNADEDVMEHFPKTLSKIETLDLIKRLQEQFLRRGYTYFAVEELESSAFIGFIGLSYQTYKSDFTPATDIGWRLKKLTWGRGFATEGAKRCLEFAFQELKLVRIISVCTFKNYKSEQVMKKIGMMKQGEFHHPELNSYPEYKKCVWYQIENEYFSTTI